MTVRNKYFVYIYLQELWFCFTQDFDSKHISVAKYRFRYMILQAVPRISDRLCSLCPMLVICNASVRIHAA